MPSLQIASSSTKHALLCAATAASVALFAAPAFAQSPPTATPAAIKADGFEGEWELPDDDNKGPSAIIVITKRGDTYGGVVKKLFPKAGEETNPLCKKCTGGRKDKPIIGMELFSNLRAADGKDGSQKLEKGSVLDPEEGKIYQSKMELAADGKTMKVTYYQTISWIGFSETWTRRN